MIHSFANRTDVPWPNAMLDRGVIIGHTTDKSSRIWVRTGKNGDFVLLVFDRKKDGLADKFTKLRQEGELTEEDLKNFSASSSAYEHPFTTSEVDNYTRVVDVDGLEPNTNYSYAVLEKKDDGRYSFFLGHDKRRRFSTRSNNEQYAFGLFSCHNPYKKKSKIISFPKWIAGSKFQPEVTNMDMWQVARSAFAKPREDTRLEFLIAGGDQAYCDGCDDINIWDYLKKAIKEKDKYGRLPNFDEMVSWFRNMYQGYWGFPVVRSVFGQYPTYMIWDDHEIRDGWGSHKLKEKNRENNEINEVLFNDWEDYFEGETFAEKQDEALKLINEMVRAAKQVYREYQHSHNPPTSDGVYDYTFNAPSSLFYVLDGRGHRDFERKKAKVLGKEQLEKFIRTVEELDPKETKFLFVVSAVPFLHSSSWLIDRAEGTLADAANVTDDLRDAWEHEDHEDERRQILDVLFKAAENGVRVCILSGDVHATAVFEMERGNHKIYQLTSSPITYATPRLVGFGLKRTIADEGESEDGYQFSRKAGPIMKPSCAIIKVDAKKNKVTFQAYIKQAVNVRKEDGASSRREKNRGDTNEETHLAPNSIVKTELTWD